MKRVWNLRLFLAALLLSLCPEGLLAQSSGQPSVPAPAHSQSQPSSPGAPKKKPRKVWTNDDVSTIPGSVSVVGDASPPEPRRKEDKNIDRQNRTNQTAVAAFRKELQTLRSQLEQVDKQISDLRNFKGENTSPSGGLKMGGRYNMVPLEEQVRQLEARRKQIQARMDDVEDQARKMSIEPGELR